MDVTDLAETAEEEGSKWFACFLLQASERRIARVGKQIEREVSMLLQGDQVVQDAMCPERRSGYDSALSAMASVTEVALSSDLQVAKIYLSIYSDDDGKATAMKALSKLQGYVRSRLASQMQMRSVPEIRFIIDDAAEKGEQVLALLQKIKRQDAGEEAMPPVTLPSLPEGEPAGSSGRGKGKKGKSSSKKDSRPDIDAAADGFMDLEDDDWFEDDFLMEDEDSEEEEDDEDFDDTDAVVEAYLAKSGAGSSAFDEFEEPMLVGGGEGKGGRRNQRRKKYKGRG